MVQLITDTQKSLLHEAIETADAVFIARCVYSIEEILDALKVLMSSQTNGRSKLR